MIMEMMINDGDNNDGANLFSKKALEVAALHPSDGHDHHDDGDDHDHGDDDHDNNGDNNDGVNLASKRFLVVMMVMMIMMVVIMMGHDKDDILKTG